MATLDQWIVNIAFPFIRRDLGVSSVAAVSWVLNAYSIVVAALLVPAGRLADLAGRRRAFLAGGVVFLVGSALCGLAPSIGTLVAARVVQAAGAALVGPAALALLLMEFPPKQRAMAIGIYAAVAGASAAAGPLLGGVLVQTTWRLVFLVNLPIGLAALIWAVTLLRESRDPSAQRPDFFGSGLLAIAVGLLALGLVEAPDWGWANVLTLAVLAAAAVGILLFWARCLRHPSPVVDPAIMRVRSFSMAVSAQVLFASGFAALLLSNVLFLTGVWGYSVLKTGLALLPGPLIASTFAVVSGRLAPRLGQRTLAVAGITLLALASVWFRWRLGPTPDYVAGMLPGQVLGGLGVGLAFPALIGAAASSLPPARFATGSAIVNMARQLGFVLGVAILIAVLDSLRGGSPMRAFDAGWVFMGISSALAVLAAIAIGDLRRPAPVAQPQMGA